MQIKKIQNIGDRKRVKRQHIKVNKEGKIIKRLKKNAGSAVRSKERIHFVCVCFRFKSSEGKYMKGQPGIEKN